MGAAIASKPPVSLIGVVAKFLPWCRRKGEAMVVFHEASPALALLETPERFSEWLGAKPIWWRASVRDGRRCPIAKYLRDAGEADVEVHPEYIQLPGGRIHPPQWATEYVYMADYGFRNSRIGRCEALDVLEKVGEMFSGGRLARTMEDVDIKDLVLQTQEVTALIRQLQRR